MALPERLAGELKAAMPAKDADRLSRLRLLKSAIGYLLVERKTQTLSDADSVSVVQSELKITALKNRRRTGRRAAAFSLVKWGLPSPEAIVILRDQ